MGEPDMSVVAFTSRTPSLNIYAVNDLMGKKGWHLNTLQASAAPPRATLPAAACLPLPAAGRHAPERRTHRCSPRRAQAPPALHFCFTAAHVGVVDLLLADLAAVCEALVANPALAEGGSAALYGVAGVSPDRGLVSDFLVAYQDTVLSVI
jgi:sphinganine-1-phosphate aldolase